MGRLSVVPFVWVSAHFLFVFGHLAAAEEPSFVVRSYRGGPAAHGVLEQCQLLREQLQKTWLGTAPCEPWKPCCEIVLHATRTSYMQAVGRGGSQSSGSSLIRTDGDKITKRRIDLLVNQHRQLTALSHELTHVVLADRFGADQAPLWADEGIATLADSAAKKSLHQKDCLEALRNGTSLRIVDLLELEQFRSPHQVPAFYGQSLSLVQFLAEHGEPSEFVSFLELAKERGYDRALREAYGIDGISHLETLWREYAISGVRPGILSGAQTAAGG